MFSQKDKFNLFLASQFVSVGHSFTLRESKTFLIKKRITLIVRKNAIAIAIVIRSGKRRPLAMFCPWLSEERVE